MKKTYKQFSEEAISKFAKGSLPDRSKFESYIKKEPVLATRIRGPFTVKTREGEVTTPDGWLAIDHHGWPYPIADNEFKAIYEELIKDA